MRCSRASEGSAFSISVTLASTALRSARVIGSRVTSSTATLFVYDLGLDYYTTFPARLAGVTAEAVRSAAQKHLVPDRLLVVAAGDRAKIEPELQKLKLGAIEVRTPEGMLVAPAGAGK